jgi:hypothetical protein
MPIHSVSCPNGFYVVVVVRLTNGESPNKVNASLFAPLLRHRILQHPILASDFGNRREEQVRAIRLPIYPGQLIERWNSLQCTTTSL